MSYKGKARALLEKYGIEEWDKVIIKTRTLEMNAVILPGPESSDYIYLKLPNGYNIAYRADSIREIKKIGKIKPSYSLPKIEIKREILEDQPTISLIHSGGTIASRVEYSTGAIAPAFSPGEISNAIPELFELANWRFEELFNIFSENISPKHWIILSEAIYKELNSGTNGVIITHGTDTLHFSASAIAFMIENLNKPVIFTGAMRSSDRPASDAAINMIGSAVYARTTNIHESVIVMHAAPSDTKCFALRGVRSLKMHSTRRDAFRSIGAPPLVEIDTERRRITILSRDYMHHSGSPSLRAKFDEKVALLYIYPGFPRDLIDILVDKGYHGIVIAGTGMGHAPEYIFDSLSRAHENGLFIVMTTQCLGGGVFMDVYETGRKLKKIGVISGRTMLPHVAYIKLGWLLGHNYPNAEIRKLLQANLRKEFVERENLFSFPPKF